MGDACGAYVRLQKWCLFAIFLTESCINDYFIVFLYVIHVFFVIFLVLHSDLGVLDSYRKTRFGTFACASRDTRIFAR